MMVLLDACRAQLPLGRAGSVHDNHQLHMVQGSYYRPTIHTFHTVNLIHTYYTAILILSMMNGS